MNWDFIKRRIFLKAVLALAAIPYLPALVSPKPKKRHLIALGSAASSLAVEPSANLGFDTVTVVTESNPKNATSEIRFIEFFRPDSAYTSFGEHKYLKKEPFQAICLPSSISNAIKSKNGEVVILAALGKYTGTVLSKSIAQEFEGMKNLHFINTIPFSFEGSYFQNQSKLIAAEISSRHKCQTLHLEDIRKSYGNLGIRSAFEKGDEELVKMFT